MIELVFTICMAAAPATCKDVRMAFGEETAQLHACWRNSQHLMAEWVGSHPEWKVTSFKCLPVSVAGEDI